MASKTAKDINLQASFPGVLLFVADIALQFGDGISHMVWIWYHIQTVN